MDKTGSKQNYTESQNDRVCKGPLEIIESKPPARAGSDCKLLFGLALNLSQDKNRVYIARRTSCEVVGK